MQIRKDIAVKHWINAAIEEMALNYTDQGYHVSKEENIWVMCVLI